LCPDLLGGLFGAVHGTVVVPGPDGGYQTVAFQNGKVTAVSSTSITLRSADGYSHTYQVTSSTLVNAQRDGIGSVKDGNQVLVDATVSGSTATAARIIDLSALQQGFHRFFGAAPGATFKMAIP
jgi:L-amino acid N-acyltransferase YncA